MRDTILYKYDANFDGKIDLEEVRVTQNAFILCMSVEILRYVILHVP